MISDEWDAMLREYYTGGDVIVQFINMLRRLLNILTQCQLLSVSI